jgi:hypothetical protein
LARCQDGPEENARVDFAMEYNIQGPDQTEDGELVFLLDETDPRTIENFKRMKALMGGSIRHDLGEKDCRGDEDERMILVCI